MALHDVALMNGQVVLPGGHVEHVNIGVCGGRIATITDPAPESSGSTATR